jgi:hypothetical protein
VTRKYLHSFLQDVLDGPCGLRDVNARDVPRFSRLGFLLTLFQLFVGLVDVLSAFGELGVV